VSEPKRYKVGKIGTTEMIDCVSYADYARLKAEVERLNNESDILQKCCEHQKNRIERLKAEVERLTERLGGVRLIVTEEMYDELNTKYLEQQHELQNIALTARQILDEKIDLKEQVERLTKAGDAMASGLQGMAGERPKALADDWNAAKEGKQS